MWSRSLTGSWHQTPFFQRILRTWCVPRQAHVWSFEAKNNCKFSCSQYSGQRYDTGSPRNERTPRCCDVGSQNTHTWKFFYSLFHVWQSFVALVIRSRFLQTVLNAAPQGALTTLDMTTLYVLEVYMFFDSIAMQKKAIFEKILKYFLYYKSETLMGRTV